MKYQVGDLVLVKDCAYCLRRPRLDFRLGNPIARHLFNTFGIITKVNNHNDVWENKSSEKDNVYFWFSQTDCREYYFVESELVEYEVIK